MFRRRWRWFGKLVSDEGFTIGYGHKSVKYTDARGAFEFGFEDELLFPKATQIAGDAIILDERELREMISRVVAGVKSEGHTVRVYSE